MRHLRSFTALFAAMWVGGCMMQSQTPPPETGPSGFGWALSMTASPDVLPKDGISTSVIRINFRDGSTNAGLGQRRIVFATTAGSLSASEAVTDASGNAAVILTAPGLNTSGQTATVSAVPVGTNFDNAVAHLIRIGLMGPDVPVASFTYTPTTVTAGSAVTFDATNSQFGGSNCGFACVYAWDFGDGTAGSNQITQHTYQNAGVRNVTLTVTGPGGASNSTTMAIVIAAAAGGGGGGGGGGSQVIASFIVTTANPTVGSPVAFDASASVGAVNYYWDYGDGNHSAGVGQSLPQGQNVYMAPGTYVVQLTVTGNGGVTASVSQPVTVN
jgi:PKD repeat protein